MTEYIKYNFTFRNFRVSSCDNVEEYLLQYERGVVASRYLCICQSVRCLNSTDSALLILHIRGKVIK